MQYSGALPFDPRQIDAPFRMQPGLRRLPPDAVHLHRLDPASALYAQKRAVSQSAQVLHRAPGFDASFALDSIRRQAGRDGLAGLDSGSPLELQMEQDLAVLDLRTGCAPWMCVSVPSGWAPEDKIGQHLATIHAPVADNAQLNAAWPQVLGLLAGAGQWERHVWNISPSDRFDQHPRRHMVPDWPSTDDPQLFASQCFLRSERQTFFPVCDPAGQAMGQVIFTIRVSLVRLTDAVRDAQGAQRMQLALVSMSDAVLDYKRLQAAHAPLRAWLSAKSAQSARDPKQLKSP